MQPVQLCSLHPTVCQIDLHGFREQISIDKRNKFKKKNNPGQPNEIEKNDVIKSQKTLKVLHESVEVNIMMYTLLYAKTSTISATKPSDMYIFFDLRNHLRSFTWRFEKLYTPFTLPYHLTE